MARLAALAALLLSLAAATVTAERVPSWYQCDCSQRENCMCPATSAPGGLSPEETPQFILFTHDDGIVSLTDRSFRSVCDGRQNPDGCPYRTTLFTTAADTDCDLAKAMYDDGYEIATHTANHIQMPKGFPLNTTVEEILGAKRFLSKECGIPADDIRGFRSPYLVTNPLVRQTLWENGFLYDSTLLEASNSESISTSMGNRAWPYTLDFGVAQNCAWFSDTQTCVDSERWPGLWEVPLWVMQVLGLEFTMDIGFYGGRGVYEPLAAAFDAAYKGNRAPVPIYVHTTWVEKNPSRLDELKQFADYTASKQDVYWVTMSQLINWMKNPIPASKLRASKGATCRRPTAPAPPPAQPALGVNVTLQLAGSPTQVADQRARLVEAVGQLLGASGTASPFVSRVTLLPGNTSADLAASEGLTAQSLEAAPATESTSSASPHGPAGWVHFEAPAAASAAGSDGAVAAQSLGDGTGSQAKSQSSSSMQVQVVVSAPAADPWALYKHAAEPSRQAAFSEQLSAMGLELAGNASVVPFKDGAALALPSPPAAPTKAPAPAPTSSPASSSPSNQQAPATAAPAADSPAAPVPTAGSGSADSGTDGNASSSSGGGSSSGLSVGAIAGICSGAAVLLVGAALFAFHMHRRRRAGAARGGATAASDPAWSAEEGEHASKESTSPNSVSISVRA